MSGNKFASSAFLTDRGEVWINGDCTDAFYCYGPKENGTNPGSPLVCPPGYYVNTDFENPRFTCTKDASICPGSFHFGCENANIPEVNCINELNPFGECGCDGQFFIGDDCRSGFYCTSDVVDPLIYDGCYRECDEGQILLPDFANNEWSCVSEDTATCRGQFNINCPEDDIGHDFDSSICECDGQMLSLIHI